MATLNIRNLPDAVHQRLRVLAAEHGRSMEAEARAILTAGVSDEDVVRHKERTAAKLRELQAFVDKLYGRNKPRNVVEDLLAERRREAAREEAE